MVRKQTLGLLCKPRLAARAHCFLAFPQVWIKGGQARSSAPPALLQAAGALAFRRAWPWGRPPTRFPCPVFPVPAPWPFITSFPGNAAITENSTGVLQSSRIFQETPSRVPGSFYHLQHFNTQQPWSTVDHSHLSVCRVSLGWDVGALIQGVVSSPVVSPVSCCG